MGKLKNCVQPNCSFRLLILYIFMRNWARSHHRQQHHNIQLLTYIHSTPLEHISTQAQESHQDYSSFVFVRHSSTVVELVAADRLVVTEEPQSRHSHRCSCSCYSDSAQVVLLLQSVIASLPKNDSRLCDFGQWQCGRRSRRRLVSFGWWFQVDRSSRFKYRVF